MSSVEFRPYTNADAIGVASVVAAAFGGDGEIKLIETLRRDGDMVCEFVAATPSEIVGHVAFSRLQMRKDGAPFAPPHLRHWLSHPRSSARGSDKRLRVWRSMDSARCPKMSSWS